MLLHIVARGKIGRSPEADLVERYLKRITWPTKVTELTGTRRELPAPRTDAVTVVLDERGKAFSSVQLRKDARALARQRQTRGALPDWRRRRPRRGPSVLGADLLLSFGPATWPHLLVRAMLAEQLFRATSILANHPYHREG